MYIHTDKYTYILIHKRERELGRGREKETAGAIEGGRECEWEEGREGGRERERGKARAGERQGERERERKGRRERDGKQEMTMMPFSCSQSQRGIRRDNLLISFYDKEI